MFSPVVVPRQATMRPGFFSPIPVCRPALPADRTDVLEFTKFIWEGHDYIQYVWDDWLADPRGVLAVAEYAGHAVALGKATYVAEGQWWLEGLRVDPKLQGLKIGSRIFEYLDNWQQRHGGGAFRLMTSWERVQVHHLCERFGWEKIGEVRAHRASAMTGQDHSFQPVSEYEIADALRFASENLSYSWGLADSGWTFGRPDGATLRQIQRAGRLYWWRKAADLDGSIGREKGTPVVSGHLMSKDAAGSLRAYIAESGLVSYWEDEDDGGRVLGAGLVACNLLSLPALLADLRRLAAEAGFASVRWHAPRDEAVESALAAAGYESMWPGSAYLFGKEH